MFIKKLDTCNGLELLSDKPEETGDRHMGRNTMVENYLGLGGSALYLFTNSRPTNLKLYY